MSDIFETLVKYCSVPGNETNLRDYLISEFEQYGTIKKTKWTGFYCAHKKNSTKKKTNIIITAHMDSPGFIVRDINEDGTIDIISLGGLHPKQMDVRMVTLQTSKKSFPGIINLVSKEATQYKGFFGFSSKKKAEKAGVQKGDSICFDSPLIKLQEGFIAAPHLDNRLGIYIMLNLAKRLQKKDFDANIYFVATSCEEVGGGRCSKIMSNMIQPDIAICLDATYEEGSVKMGQGPVLTLSDAGVLLPTKIRDALSKLAKKSKQALQFEVYNYASTDAKDFRASNEGCITLSLLVATLNNHTPHEICSTKDIVATEKFIIEILKHHNNLII